MSALVEGGVEIIEACRRDPVFFLEEILGRDLTDYQREIARLMAPKACDVTVASANGVGKTGVSSSLTLWHVWSFWPSVTTTTAPTQRQVRDQLWKEIGKQYRDAPFDLGGMLDLQRLTYDRDHFAVGQTARDPTSFQGQHELFNMAVVEEAAGVARPIFEEGVEAILTGENSRFLKIGNPTDTDGVFYESFANPVGETMRITAFDNPNFAHFGITLDDFLRQPDDGGPPFWERKIDGPLPRPYLTTPAWVARVLKRWGLESPAFQSRVLARFPDQGEDTLIRLGWVELAKALSKGEVERGSREIGLDVARGGSDESVAVLREGMWARVERSWRGLDTWQLANEVKALAAEVDAHRIKIDSIGVGAGVFDRLKRDPAVRAMGIEVLECVGSAKPQDPTRFANARAEWFWNLREWFEQSAIAIDPDDDLEGQLVGLKFKIRPGSGTILIEPKEDFKKRNGNSPDRADALAYAFATPGQNRTFAFT